MFFHPAVFVTGEIPRSAALEAPTNRYFLDPEYTTADPFNDEQALALETSAGVVVVIGCVHAGTVLRLNGQREAVDEPPMAAGLTPTA